MSPRPLQTLCSSTAFLTASHHLRIKSRRLVSLARRVSPPFCRKYLCAIAKAIMAGESGKPSSSYALHLCHNYLGASVTGIWTPMSTSLASKLYFSSLAEPARLRAHAHAESEVWPPNQNTFPTPLKRNSHTHT